MGQATLPGNPPIDVILKRSRRARRVSLRVSGLDGRVTLSIPATMPEREALDFAAEKADWIRKHLAKRPAPSEPGQAGRVMFRGVDLALIPHPGRSARLDGETLRVPQDAARVTPALRAFLKEEARRALGEASDRYAARLGVSYGRITLRDTRSRWGSCSSDGNLMYSWRLAMAPPEVLDYVAAHEVAHLRHMDHSPRFWSVVAGVCPGFDTHRRWLRDNGAALHRYRFD
ncbi:M48 family metallopeptidase [Anianabacter salinae]|uniref:M48 family metallopeptidase n=1 Tax=Anianabacter salinae TaxID=2851023 RepID=UPI00225E1E1E|nr:SprT family zinc-dependent metalloprotease [Anianabacter salinae]MBV0913036.1 M48 family metallopeptidase [Anianabacter salinae]